MSFLLVCSHSQFELMVVKRIENDGDDCWVGLRSFFDFHFPSFGGVSFGWKNDVSQSSRMIGLARFLRKIAGQNHFGKKSKRALSPHSSDTCHPWNESWCFILPSCAGSKDLEMGDSGTATKGQLVQCFLKVSIGGEILKDIVLELDTPNYPKTCESFLSLCCNDARTSSKDPNPTYRGCEFHRIVPGFCVQAGDWERFDGTGGFSPLYGRNWKDEISKHGASKHDREGVLSMANSGPNTNGSQFFVTLKPTPHLDGKHTAFGRVVSGMESVRKMVDVERGAKDRPVSLQRIVIEDCGRVVHKEQEDSKASKRSRKRDKKRDKKKRHRRRYDDSSSDSSSSDESDDNDSVSRKRKRHRRERHPRIHGKKKRRRRDRDSSSDDVSYDSSSTDDSRGQKHKRRKSSREKRSGRERKQSHRERKRRKDEKRR